jgi:uncharacterized protein
MDKEIYKKYNLDESLVIKKIQHCDFIKNDNSKMVKTDQGFLVGMAPVAKVGIMSYLLADGSVCREFVPEETLFNKDSMESLKMKPVTDKHPIERVVDSRNAPLRQVGFTGETIKNIDGMLFCTMTITHDGAINDIEHGRQELSPGYEAELVFKKGTFNNEEYDAIQVKRNYNHVAVVDSARGGADIRFNLDSKIHLDGIETSKYNDFSEKLLNQEKKMLKFKIDGIEYDAAPEVVNFINKINTQLNDEKVAVKTANDTIQTISAERDTLKVKVDNLEKRDIQKEINDAVSARLELERVADVVLDEVDEVDEKLDNRALKVAIITKKMPEIAKKIDEKTSLVYIDAVLDAVIASLTTDEVDSLAAQRKISAHVDDASNNDENKNDDEEARKRMIEKQKNAYKKEDKETVIGKRKNQANEM